MRRPRRQAISIGSVIVVIALIALYLLLQHYANPTDPANNQPPTTASSAQSSATSAHAQIEQLFDSQISDVQVSGSGHVRRILADDNEGDRHQRFILELDSGLTVLVAHNIDLAERLDGLAVGDRVGFNGEYVYSEQGGTIHWTHHDPHGSHEDGWLESSGHRFG